jgi:hypothetical protein
VVGQRVERSNGGCEQEEAAGAECGRTPALDLLASDGQRVRETERDDRQRRLEVKSPGVRIWTEDGATLESRSRA